MLATLRWKDLEQLEGTATTKQKQNKDKRDRFATCYLSSQNKLSPLSSRKTKTLTKQARNRVFSPLINATLLLSIYGRPRLVKALHIHISSHLISQRLIASVIILLTIEMRIKNLKKFNHLAQSNYLINARRASEPSSPRL